MKRTAVILPLFFLAVLSDIFVSKQAHAQSGGWVWGRGNNNSSMDAFAVATDSAGNVYGAGINFGRSTATFGGVFFPFSAAHGIEGGLDSMQALWVKYSNAGVPLWARGTSNGSAYLFNITTDARGNLIVFGAFNSPTLTLDTVTLTNIYGTAGHNQYFLAKYDPAGTLLWAIRDGNTADTLPEMLGVVNAMSAGGVTTDAAGNIYITSSFKKPGMSIGTDTFTNQDPSGATVDIFVAKYNSSGILQWARSVGGASDDMSYGIAVGNAGNLYITGAFWSPGMTIGSSTIANPYSTGGFTSGAVPLAYIAKFSPTGVPLWAQAAGGSNGAYGVGIVSDPAGNIYVTGGFADSSISFGADTLTRTYLYTAPEYLALYLVQYSPADIVTWHKTIESQESPIYGLSIALAACGEVWVSGAYSGGDANIDGHIIPYTDGYDPVFIAGYTLSGDVIGYSALGSGGDDQNSIACDRNGNVFICSDYMTLYPMTIGPDVLPSLLSYEELFYLGKYQNIPINANDTLHYTIDTTVCNLPQAILAATNGYTTYLWDNASGLNTRTVTSSGKYWVVCSSTCNIPPAIDTFHVIIGSSDTTHGRIDTSACVTGTLMLTADPGYTSYKWSTGSTAPSIAVSNNGVYWLAELNGCSLRLDTFDITLRLAAEVNLGNDTAICTGELLHLAGPVSAGVSYLWSDGSTAASIDVTQSGEYSLTVNENGCTTADSINVSFLQLPSLSLASDTTICDEPQAIISDGNSTTVWSNGQTGGEITITSPGVYYATISNQCGTVTDSIKVNFAYCSILVPTAFTPNNDGKNDFFKVEGQSLGRYTGFSLSIYDRWGRRIFHTENINDGWDGNFNGVPQDLGTYFYMISYSLNGKSHMQKGDLTLVR